MPAGISNERLRRLARLGQAKVRAEEGLQLLEGPRLVGEALLHGAVSELFVADAVAAATYEDAPVPVHVVGKPWMERLADVRTPQSVLAIGPLPALGDLPIVLQGHERCLLLDGVQDPGNVGALARTAAALGVGGLVLLGPCADVGSPKVLRASAGALFRLELARCQDAPELASALGARAGDLVVPVVRAGEDLRAFTPPARYVLALGNEGAGSDLADAVPGARRLTIPMAGGVESLNVAATAAVILGRWL